MRVEKNPRRSAGRSPLSALCQQRRQGWRGRLHRRAGTAPAGASARGARNGGRGLSAPWHRVCRLDDILPNSGAAALVEGRQIAMFRVGDALYAVGNYDPASGINVLSRGIVGDVGGEGVVAS